MEDTDSRPHKEEDRPPLDYDPDYVHTEGYFRGFKNRDIPDEYDRWRKKYQKPVVDFSQVSYLDDRDKGVVDSKAYMVHEILKSGDQRFSFELLDEVKLKPTGEEKLSLYFRDVRIADYYPKTGQVEESTTFGMKTTALRDFKELAEKVYHIRLNVSESSYSQNLLRQTEETPFDFDNFMEELEELKLESEVPEAIKEDAQVTMEETISLESTQFKIDIERAKEYQQKIESLEQEIKDLKAQSISSDEKQRKIDSLERQLENLTEDAKDEIKKLEQTLQLKGHQLLETQKEVDYIQKEKESLNARIQSSEKDNEDLLADLKSLEQRFKTETERLKRERDSYKTEKENLEKLLESNVDSKVQEISTLVEENERLKKQGKKFFSYQESLQKKVSELNSHLQKLQDNYDARLAISEDQEETIKENKRDIHKKEQKILDYEKENKRLSFFEKRAEELEGLFNEQKKIIKTKQQELDVQKQQYEEQISSLSQEKFSLSKQRDETQFQLDSLETEIKTAEENKSQLRKERDSKFSQVQEYERQIKKLNTDINVYRNKIQSLETENKNLKTASTKSSQDYSKQIKDIKEKIHREEVKPLQDRIKDLEGSVRNYKGSWDDADKAHKSSLQKYKEDAIKLNSEKKDLVGKLKLKDADYLSLQRKLIENENKFSLLQSKYNKLFNKSEKDLETLTVERDALLQREKQAIEELKYRRERIEAMSKNVEEYKKQVLELEDEVNSAYNKIELNKVKQTQFDRLTSERNDYVQRLNRAVGDRDVLQQNLKKRIKSFKN